MRSRFIPAPGSFSAVTTMSSMPKSVIEENFTITCTVSSKDSETVEIRKIRTHSYYLDITVAYTFLALQQSLYLSCGLYIPSLTLHNVTRL